VRHPAARVFAVFVTTVVAGNLPLDFYQNAERAQLLDDAAS